MLATLIINKYIAIFFGPSFTTAFGNFQNFNQILLIISSGGINQGVTKYIAEFKDNPEKLNLIMSGGLKIVLLCSSISAFIGFFLASSVSELIFNTKEYESLIKFTCVTVFFSSLNLFFLAIINGLSLVAVYIKMNVVQSILILISSIFSMLFWGFQGALFSLSIAQVAISCVIFRYFFLNGKLLTIKYSNVCGGGALMMFLPFIVMTITSSILHPVSMMLIRSYISERISIEIAGFWSAGTYISSMLLTIFSTAIATYYLPKISRLTCKGELFKELKGGLAFAIPVSAVILALIFCLRDFIVVSLFTKDYTPISEFIGWQLLGDFVKIVSWFFSYFMIAKKLTSYYLITEVLLYLSFCLLSMVFIGLYAFPGVGIAYLVSNLIYLLLVVIVFFRWFYLGATKSEC